MRNNKYFWKIIIFCLVIAGHCDFMVGQNADINRNYVLSTTYIDNGSISSIQYFDGLGRPSEAVQYGLGSNGGGSYHRIEYDLNGREYIKWLAKPLEEDYSDPYSFSQTTYDALDRPLTASTPGETWHSAGKVKTIAYISNNQDEVKYYYTSGYAASSLVDRGYYPPHTLKGEIMEDEDGHRLKTFKDFMGNVILERQYSEQDSCDTYYVYYAYKLLRYVLTPQYQSDNDVAINGYTYTYDDMWRVVSKQLPGCSAITYVYDQADRNVIMRDGLLEERDLCRVFFYDIFGRLCIQGILDYNGGQALPDNFTSCITVSPNGTGSEIGGTGYKLAQGNIDTNGIEIEIVNYYDDYGYLSNPEWAQDDFSNSNFVGLPNSKGSLTGQIVATTNGESLYSSFYYDNKGRLTEEYHSTLDGDVYKVFTSYTFTDKPATVTKVLPGQGSGNDYTVTHSYKYNRYNDQLEKDSIYLSSGAYGLSKVVSELTYNDLGQIVRDRRPEINDNITYSYDIHGWTKSISSQYFSEELFYADGPNTDSFCYNGNISALAWIGSDEITRGYKFKYNDMDMLYQSSYGEGENLTLHTGRYNENITEFNSNGAIVHLTRRGKTNSDSYGIIDYLIYDYDGNKVTGIRDRYPTLLSYNGAFEYRNTHTATAAEPDFEYNSAGMLIKDRDKGISNITYNNIGLVEDIQFDNGARIAYVYSLTGEKLKVTHYSPLAFINPIRLSASQAEEGTTSSTDDRIVSPGIQYPSVIKSSEMAYLGGDVQIDCMNGDYTHLFGGGYLKFNPDLMSVPKFYYYAKDHLGNIRSVATKTNGVVEEVQHTAYYPFGGIIADLSTGRDVQNHLYNGKELDYSNNLWWYDYGARQHDPTGPRFTTPDPLAELVYNQNIFMYANNNPVYYMDLFGLKGIPASNVDWSNFNIYDDWVELPTVTVTAQRTQNKPEQSTLYVYPNEEQSSQWPHWNELTPSQEITIADYSRNWLGNYCNYKGTEFKSQITWDFKQLHKKFTGKKINTPTSDIYRGVIPNWSKRLSKGLNVAGSLSSLAENASEIIRTDKVTIGNVYDIVFAGLTMACPAVSVATGVYWGADVILTLATGNGNRYYINKLSDNIYGGNTLLKF